MVECYSPLTLEEALEIMSKKKCIPLAGGSDLMIKRNFENPVIFIKELLELKELEKNEDFLKIGSCVTLYELDKSGISPVISDIIKTVSSPGIRNTATIGGNICNDSPIGDFLPLLYALDAELTLSKKGSERVIPIEYFIHGAKNTILASDELLKEIRLFPMENEDYSFFWKKVSGRDSNALTKASVFSAYKIKHGKLTDLRIAIGGMGPMIVRSKLIEKQLIKALNENGDVNKILEEYFKFFSPVSDQRSTASYKLKAVRNVLDGLTKKLKGVIL